ncbi:glycosyltransferase involved in cell wall biosynthesis [Litoreibacter meonggei]|uniref:Glycosyltransferase involved in cell wall biosynthesis n=1 Tax=Litoreibacter meonggei TaxID=1049199 RepID=A0A497UYT5_9RHOB|nr:glycosyltransferase family 4 protein [Litoreibacter meonggei]RLJ36210.1 glycosyltransferase involved in cell wall biosynthesis [Litoreibacter meonggei]
MNDTFSLPRIAYLTGQYPTVSHTFILREVEALRRLGFEVLTCSVRRTSPEQHPGPAEQQEARTTFYILQAAKNPATLLKAQKLIFSHPKRYFGALSLAWKTRSAGLRAALYQLFYFAEATVLADHLQSRGVTHLHNHFAEGSANVAMLASQLSGIPFSYTLHGPADLLEPRRWALGEKTARAEFVACISNFARSQVMLFSDPVHWHKLRIIHCGVTPDRYHSSETPNTPDPQSGAHLVFVGRLAAVKGLRILLEGFTAARVSRPDLRLTLVGDGDDRAHLEKLAKPLGDAVQFVGYKSQDEVAAILAEADMLVLPSFAEGVPVVLMEAMASGKPVIASLVAGVPELVDDGVSGFLVPPGDVDTFAARLGQLADDPALRVRMGIAGRSKVQAEFDISQEAARIGALFAGTGGDMPRPEPYMPD